MNSRLVRPWRVMGALAGIYLLAVAAGVDARPMNGEIVSIRQSNGVDVTMRVWGDEFYAVGETVDGYTVVRDSITGLFCYARRSADGRELESTGKPMREMPPPGLVPHVRIDQDAARQKALRARSDFERRANAGQPDPRVQSASGPTLGSVVGIVLLVDFSDDNGTIPAANVGDYCNLSGYTGYGNNGSVYDYFYDVSSGLLEYTNFVPTHYYRASHTKAYYCDASIPYGQRAAQLVVEALTALNSAGFNFSHYDADGNGVIDAVNCLYAGGVWNQWAEGLWPHSGGVTYSADGVRTDRYQITNMGAQLAIGTFCHENGHMLMGWPDFYDYDYDSTGLGYFCLMSYGNHVADGLNPVQPCAYLKVQAGWADVVNLDTPQQGVTVPAQGNTVYKYRHPYNSNEYYLVENRQQTGRDVGLPDQGIAIWHVDTHGSNNDQEQTPWRHYLVTLVQADGAWDLEHGANYGDATDLFAAPLYRMCTPLTSPGTNWWDGSYSFLSVTDISTANPVMTLTYDNPNVDVVTRTYMEFSTTLEPGVTYKWSLGTVDAARAYVPEIDPLTSAEILFEKAAVMPVFVSGHWRDVLSLRTRSIDPPCDVHVRVYQTSGFPVAHSWVANLAPGVLQGYILGPSSEVQGYIPEVSPLTTTTGVVERLFVQPEFNGTQWNDVLRVQAGSGSPTLNVRLRAYEAGSLPVLYQFTAHLQPGVLHGYQLGPSSRDRTYIPEISPVNNREVVIEKIIVQPEYNGTTWNDVLRLQIRTQDPALDVGVRIYVLEEDPLTSIADGETGRVSSEKARLICYPSPFNPCTTIAFDLAQPGPVQLRIFDLRGQLVKTLLAETLPAGRHEVRWDGRDDDGREAPSSVYLSRLEAGGESAVGRMTLVR